MINIAKVLRPKNMTEVHSIPIGTLVEVNLPSDDQHGIRAFVVDHTRDCDGSPMYAISMTPVNELKEIRTLFGEQMYRFMISDGWDIGCLLVIRQVTEEPFYA